MAHQDDPRTRGTRGLRNEGVTGPAGRSDQTRWRLVPGPDKATPLRAQGACGRPNTRVPAGRIGAQTVIDAEDDESPVAASCPVRDQMKQGDGIATTRYSHRQRLPGTMHQPTIQTIEDSIGPVGRQPHSAWLLIWPARVRTAALARSA